MVDPGRGSVAAADTGRRVRPNADRTHVRALPRGRGSGVHDVERRHRQLGDRLPVGSGGALIPSGTFSTHGLGTGSSLADSGALALTANHQFLLVVNAGSQSLTVFRVNAGAPARC